MAIDRFTGKPIPRPSDALPQLNGGKCDVCGTPTIDHCIHCGAPQCCPKCCQESMELDPFEGSNIWKLCKVGLKRPILVCGGIRLVPDAKSAYELAEQVGEASGGADSYDITKLTTEEYSKVKECYV